MIPRLQKIEDVKLPAVGRYYQVRCAYGKRPHLSKQREWWPVIGSWHEDADIGVAAYHFHYDVRFYSEAEFNRGRIPHLAQVHTWGLVDSAMSDQTAPVRTEYFRMKMRRQMPDFPADPPFLWKLEDLFRDVTLKCRVCPHRGFSLEGLQRAADGTVLCNGHGLKWNLETGRLVARKGAKP